MENNFTVDKANTFLFITLGKLPTLNLSITNPPFIKVAIFSDAILVLSYYGCKGETINLIPHYYRYCLQNCTSITFREITNYKKYK